MCCFDICLKLPSWSSASPALHSITCLGALALRGCLWSRSCNLLILTSHNPFYQSYKVKILLCTTMSPSSSNQRWGFSGVRKLSILARLCIIAMCTFGGRVAFICSLRMFAKACVGTRLRGIISLKGYSSSISHGHHKCWWTWPAVSKFEWYPSSRWGKDHMEPFSRNLRIFSNVNIHKEKKTC